MEGHNLLKAGLVIFADAVYMAPAPMQMAPAPGPIQQAGNPLQSGASHNMEDESLPIALVIANSTSSNINGVVLFGANDNAYASSSNFGNPSGISITDGYGNTTYQAILSNSLQKPMLIGSVMLVSTVTGGASTTYRIKHKTDNGQDNTYSVPIIPYLDQFESNQALINQEHPIDGYTFIYIGTVLANSSLTLYFYMKHRFSPTSLAMGKPSGQFNFARSPLTFPPFSRQLLSAGNK